MSKRRTREQKIKAQTKYQISLKREENQVTNIPVKSYFISEKQIRKAKKSLGNNSMNTEQYLNLKLIKKDLIKSLLVSSFILCLIVVLYFTWYKL